MFAILTSAYSMHMHICKFIVKQPHYVQMCKGTPDLTRSAARADLKS